MIDLTKQYQTKCGYPVRNLVSTTFVYEGEYFHKDEWHLGAWTCSGEPDLFTSDLALIASLTLVEISDTLFLPSQLDLF